MITVLQQPKFYVYGSGTPVIGFVSGVHGNEDISSKLLEFFSTINLLRGTVIFIVAHPSAISQQVRFIESDLNRSFPGDMKGTLEEQIAYSLRPIITNCDYLVDFHSFYSPSETFTVIPHLEEKYINLAKRCNILKNVIMPSKNVSLIDYTSCGIGAELGRIGDPGRIQIAKEIVFSLLSSVQMVDQKTEILNLEYFISDSKIALPKHYKLNEKLHNFIQVQVGEVLAHSDTDNLIATEEFLPILLNTLAYKGILCRKAKQIYL